MNKLVIVFSDSEPKHSKLLLDRTWHNENMYTDKSMPDEEVWLPMLNLRFYLNANGNILVRAGYGGKTYFKSKKEAADYIVDNKISEFKMSELNQYEAAEALLKKVEKEVLKLAKKAYAEVPVWARKQKRNTTKLSKVKEK